MSVTIAVIEQVGGMHGTQVLELIQPTTGWLRLISRWVYHSGPQDFSDVYLRPEDVIGLADALKDYLDDEAGKGEDIEGT